MSDEFIRFFEEKGVKISVGERGFRDNIYMERLWRKFKYEHVYLKETPSLKDLQKIAVIMVPGYSRA